MSSSFSLPAPIQKTHAKNNSSSCSALKVQLSQKNLRDEKDKEKEDNTHLMPPLNVVVRRPRVQTQSEPAPKTSFNVAGVSFGSSDACCRIAYFMHNKDCTFKPWIFLCERLYGYETFHAEQVTAEEIVAGALEQPRYNTLIIPGGMAEEHSNILGLVGKQQILKFIQNGGGFLGLCAGAYLCCTDISGDLSYLWGILKIGAADVLHWNRGSGNHCYLQYTPAGKTVFYGQTTDDVEQPDVVEVRYANGPIMRPLREQGDQSSQTCVLAVFLSEYAKNGARKGAMIGSAAIVAGNFGSGRVIACSPHPEKSDSARIGPHLRNLLLWCCNSIG